MSSSTSKDLKYLYDIQNSISLIFDALKDNDKLFFENIHIQNAIYRYFEIIGEVAKRLSTEFKSKHHEINWKNIAGLRDVIIHQYDGVDPNEVWEIIKNDLDKLGKQINTLIAAYNS